MQGISTKQSLTARSHQLPFNGCDSDPNPTIFLSSWLTLLERPLGLLISHTLLLFDPTASSIHLHRAFSSSPPKSNNWTVWIDRTAPISRPPFVVFFVRLALSLSLSPLTPPDSSSPPSPFSSKPPLRSQKRSKGEN